MALLEYLQKKQQPQQVQQPVQPQQQITMPTDGNYVGWMNELMGPTPAEREAQERRLAENRAKMNGWLGLFQGLGALGDLYYASKGVNPSKPDYSAQTIVNNNAKEAQQRIDNLYKNRQAYATMLYNLQRQAKEDTRKDKLADAQAQWYSTRDEMARDKAELEKLKSARVIKMPNGSLMKFDPVSGTAEPLTEADPLYVKWKEAQINKMNRTGGGGGKSAGVPYKEHYVEDFVDPATGKKVKMYVSGRYGASSSTPTPQKQASKSNHQSKSSTKSGSGSAKSKVSIRGNKK